MDTQPLRSDPWPFLYLKIWLFKVSRIRIISSHSSREYVVELRKAIGATIPAVIKRLEDKDVSVRLAAALALSRFAGYGKLNPDTLVL